MFGILLTMQIFLMRHGQDLNPDQARLTDADPAVSDLGKEEAARCAIKIKAALEPGVRPLIIASPRVRTMQTAAIVAAQLGEDPTSVTFDARLRERDCSAFSGQLVSEVFSLDEENLVDGGMEPYSQLEERLSSFYDELLMKIDAPIIIVTHSGSIEPLMKLAKIDAPYTLEADNFVRLK